MSTFTKHFMVAVISAFALFFGSVQNVRAGAIENSGPAGCGNLPVIKNLTGLKAQHECDRMLAPKELTKGDVKKLTATANSPEDHLRLARYFRTEANCLAEQAAGYEEAAAKLRNAPAVKNFVAPTTAARYALAANTFREEAKANLAIAASHEEMAKAVVASLN
jgi:hypothetical protein